MAQQVHDDPIQATAIAHNQTNIHLQSEHDAEPLYQVDQGAKLAPGKEKQIATRPATPRKKKKR